MEKYLVIQMARFGDILQSGRLMRTLQSRGETHLCVDKSLESLARLAYPGCIIHGLPAHGRDAGQVLGGASAVLAELGAQRFDAVYNLNHAGLNRALAALFDPDTVRGYRMRNGAPQRDVWLDMGFRWTERRRHAPMHLTDFWAMLAPTPIAPALVNPAAKPGGKGLGIVMAGQNPRRSLEPQTLALLARAAYERCGSKIYLLGGERERPLARQLMGHLGTLAGKTENLAGRTDFAALADAVTGLDLLLSPDTGTAHLAAHVGTPVAAFYCSSAWAWETGPYGLGHTVWQNVMPCAPCLEAAPCALGQAPCRNLYAQGAFLLALSGKPGRKEAQELRPLSPAFDDLGLIWNSAEKEDDTAEARERARLRNLLAEWLGRATVGEIGGAELLFREKDWMLAQGGPHESVV